MRKTLGEKVGGVRGGEGKAKKKENKRPPTKTFAFPLLGPQLWHPGAATAHTSFT